MRILVVEDQAKLAGFIREALGAQGFTVVVCGDGREAFAVAKTEPFDAIVLDIMLPGRDGLSILKGLRAAGVATPILLLTARNELNERVEGFQLGADDYLTKPFHMEELAVRLQALIRRAAGQVQDVYEVGDLRMDVQAREVTRGARRLVLTQREFALLELLMRSPGRVFTRTQISARVWESPVDVGTNMIDVAMTRLRKKVEAPGEEKVIHTRRGVGYLLEAVEG